MTTAAETQLSEIITVLEGAVEGLSGRVGAKGRANIADEIGDVLERMYGWRKAMQEAPAGD